MSAQAFLGCLAISAVPHPATLVQEGVESEIPFFAEPISVERQEGKLAGKLYAEIHPTRESVNVEWSLFPEATSERFVGSNGLVAERAFDTEFLPTSLAAFDVGYVVVAGVDAQGMCVVQTWTFDDPVLSPSGTLNIPDPARRTLDTNWLGGEWPALRQQPRINALVPIERLEVPAQLGDKEEYEAYVNEDYLNFREVLGFDAVSRHLVRFRTDEAPSPYLINMDCFLGSVQPQGLAPFDMQLPEEESLGDYRSAERVRIGRSGILYVFFDNKGEKDLLVFDELGDGYPHKDHFELRDVSKMPALNGLEKLVMETFIDKKKGVNAEPCQQGHRENDDD